MFRFKQIKSWKKVLLLIGLMIAFLSPCGIIDSVEQAGTALEGSPIDPN